MDLPFYPKAPGESETIVFQEIYSLGARLFYLGAAIFWCLPLLTWEQMPDNVRWMVVALTLFSEPFFLWYAAGRRIVEIDFSRRLVTVQYGLLLPFTKRNYDLDTFQKVSIVERIDSSDSGGATDATGIYRSENSHKITAKFYLSGEKELLLYEFCFNSKDEQFKRKYKDLRSSLPEYIESRLKRV